MNIAEAKEKVNLIRDNIGKVIVGKDETVKNVLICLIADGHVLLEDLPGTGKTSFAKMLAKSAKLNLKNSILI